MTHRNRWCSQRMKPPFLVGIFQFAMLVITRPGLCPWGLSTRPSGPKVNSPSWTDGAILTGHVASYGREKWEDSEEVMTWCPKNPKKTGVSGTSGPWFLLNHVMFEFCHRHTNPFHLWRSFMMICSPFFFRRRAFNRICSALCLQSWPEHFPREWWKLLTSEKPRFVQISVEAKPTKIEIVKLC